MSELLAFVDGKWTIVKGSSNEEEGANIKQICLYYANLIGYVRVGMALAAAWLIPAQCHLVIGLLLLASTLLDWIDGPIARAFHQTSIFGGGLDWFADLLVQVAIMVWWTTLDISSAQLQFMFTSVELGSALLDFGIAARGKYAKLGKQFFLMNYYIPNGSWTNFATTCWISYHIWAISWCIYLGYPGSEGLVMYLSLGLRWGLLIPSALFMFFETLNMVYLLDCWREPKSTITNVIVK
mmetsp:Transcript_1747/g.2262  ORF Transcript_1747/g.2262 Transcript_1747/m.2262 type:complete len:239 (+) Transcript_1747:136-852(+)|eukprot:CAMPEP_0168547850 /NCGR_PEP_ID=MMETSP0413-20121227/4251_1 /TAXON_ID=136452 /ORGANISM="Filamoeba nolandi, Strain NC-AS-23-1" /LENGTH=238 /DNA_ID=CAMNT_0008578121 /DNA_START=119 /DNA_END=835 /DNA_ORIENTATION=+